MGSHRVGHNWSDLAAAAAAVYVCHSILLIHPTSSSLSCWHVHSLYLHLYSCLENRYHFFFRFCIYVLSLALCICTLLRGRQDPPSIIFWKRKFLFSIFSKLCLGWNPKCSSNSQVAFAELLLMILFWFQEVSGSASVLGDWSRLAQLWNHDVTDSIFFLSLLASVVIPTILVSKSISNLF